MYHFVLALLVLVILIGAVINLFKSMDGPGLYSASLILAIAVSLVLLWLYARVFPLKAQDRAIRAEENLRHYARNGRLLDPSLTMRQVIGLRFASGDEYDELAARAVAESLSEDDIKKAIRNWKADHDRV